MTNNKLINVKPAKIDFRALRKAALKAKTTDDWGCDAGNFHDRATPDAVLALLDELEARTASEALYKASLNQADAELQEYRNAAKWISCNDAIPEDGEVCLAVDADCVIWTVVCEDSELVPDTGCKFDSTVFTHWMPLPAGPNGL